MDFSEVRLTFGERVARAACCTLTILLLLALVIVTALMVSEGRHQQRQHRSFLTAFAHRASVRASEFAEEHGHYPRTREEYERLDDGVGASYLDAIESHARRVGYSLDTFQVQPDVEPGASEWVAAFSGRKGRVELWGDGTVAVSADLARRPQDGAEWLRVLSEP